MKDFIKVMKALSDPNRLKIIKLLQQGAMFVSEIQSVLGISQPAVSRHLRVLENAGLVSHHKEGIGGEAPPYERRGQPPCGETPFG